MLWGAFTLLMQFLYFPIKKKKKKNKHINKLFHKFHGFSSKKKHNTICEYGFPGTSHNG